ncbi:MAG: DJ-1/PfpI family protein [Fimbriimonadaceae bacterium]|nr:DJ-1/PfpI family protein [Fimbriimonadaceae bacterium]
MAQVLLVIGDATEQMDTLYPYFRIPEEGYTLHVAAPEARLIHMVAHQVPPGWDVTREFEGYKLPADIAFRDVREEDYLGLVISGGRAPEYLRYDEDLLRITRHFFATGKPVASICHGIEIVATADVIRGRRVTTVPKCKFDAEVCGATFVDAPVVVDGNLVCSRTWWDSAPWMREFLKLLNAARDAVAGS